MEVLPSSTMRWRLKSSKLQISCMYFSKHQNYIKKIGHDKPYFSKLIDYLFLA